MDNESKMQIFEIINVALAIYVQFETGFSLTTSVFLVIFSTMKYKNVGDENEYGFLL